MLLFFKKEKEENAYNRTSSAFTQKAHTQTNIFTNIYIEASLFFH